MIVAAIVAVWVAFLELVVSWIPTGTAPEWLGSGADLVLELLTKGAGVGNWFPFQLAAVVIASVLACVLVGFGIKMVRIIASFFTAGGGSAA